MKTRFGGRSAATVDEAAEQPHKNRAVNGSVFIDRNPRDLRGLGALGDGFTEVLGRSPAVSCEPDHRADMGHLKAFTRRSASDFEEKKPMLGVNDSALACAGTSFLSPPFS